MKGINWPTNLILRVKNASAQNEIWNKNINNYPDITKFAAKCIEEVLFEVFFFHNIVFIMFLVC